MAIPKFQEITLPMLQLAADGKIWSLAEAREELARHFQLSAEEQEELLPSGRQARFANRVAWAKVYLQRGGLLASPERAHFQITARGREVLLNPPDQISINYLSQYPEFQEFRNPSSKPEGPESLDAGDSDTPEEILESAYVTIRKNLASEILDRVKSCSPRFFEHLVVDLLLKMGYGRAGEGAGERVGQSGDEGIDGIISEDRLGLEMVYLQQSDGKAQLVGQKFKSLLGLCTVEGPGRAYSLPPALFPLRPQPMFKILTRKWCSSMANS